MLSYNARLSTKHVRNRTAALALQGRCSTDNPMLRPAAKNRWRTRRELNSLNSDRQSDASPFGFACMAESVGIDPTRYYTASVAVFRTACPATGGTLHLVTRAESGAGDRIRTDSVLFTREALVLTRSTGVETTVGVAPTIAALQADPLCCLGTSSYWWVRRDSNSVKRD